MDESTTIYIIKIGVSMRQFFTSREEYIAVLQNEVEILRRYYYKPQSSGTGHFNTAISVLEQRIEELQRMSDAA
jgi:uncharacterized protein with von Willebrand factor type A (vWA) domain